MKCHHHSSTLKWHDSAHVVSYIYFDVLKPTLQKSAVLDGIEDSGDHLSVSSFTGTILNSGTCASPTILGSTRGQYTYNELSP